VSSEWRRSEEEGLQLFGKGGLSRAIDAAREAIGATSGEPLKRKDVVLAFRTRPISRNFSSFYELSHFYALNPTEKSCVRDKILSISGDINLMYPGTDFSECLKRPSLMEAGDEPQLDQLKDKLDAENYWTTLVPETLLGPPMPDAQYRGWYYCYRQAGACGTSARNAVRWDPGLSVFHGRPAERNNGIDLFSATHVDGASTLQAVARGRLHYLKTPVWGHALALPFAFESRKYLAIYGYLPDSAKEKDGAWVEKGQIIGVTGCSGETGRDGVCNSYCKYGGVFHTDESLHFELRQIDRAEFLPVNPIDAIQNWKPFIDRNGVGNRLCSECRNGNCLPDPVPGVH
jgi:hypothetical protein